MSRSIKRSSLVPAGAPSWITDELMKDTLRIWGPKYESTGESLTPDDALEIIINMSELADALEIREVDGELYVPDPEHQESNERKLAKLELGRKEGAVKRSNETSQDAS